MALLRDADCTRSFTLARGGCRWSVAALQFHLHPGETNETTISIVVCSAAATMRGSGDCRNRGTTLCQFPEVSDEPWGRFGTVTGAWSPRARAAFQVQVGTACDRSRTLVESPDASDMFIQTRYPPAAGTTGRVGLRGTVLELLCSRSATRSQCRSISIRRVSEHRRPALGPGLIARRRGWCRL